MNQIKLVHFYVEMNKSKYGSQFVVARGKNHVRLIKGFPSQSFPENSQQQLTPRYLFPAKWTWASGVSKCAQASYFVKKCIH